MVIQRRNLLQKCDMTPGGCLVARFSVCPIEKAKEGGGWDA